MSASRRDRRGPPFGRPARTFLATACLVCVPSLAMPRAAELPQNAPGTASGPSAPGLPQRAPARAPNPLTPVPREPPPGGRSADPLVRILKRVERFLAAHEVDGVMLDSRYALDPTEVVRLTATCQLLGYVELYRTLPRPHFKRAVGRAADYLAERFDIVRSGTVFDGMLGYAFLEAYEVTGNARDLEYGARVVAELEGIPHSEYILNGGLMAAMAFAKYGKLTGDATATSLAHEILAGVPPYQHVDGSFPHWCACSRDVSYTDWMSMELILIERDLSDPVIEPMLDGTRRLMEERIDGNGHTSYEAPCADYPGCVQYYYSIATGCDIDYDTRAFTNEVGYSALLFDHTHSTRYAPLVAFADAIENGGVWADKWDFWPPPTDPYYPWTVADTSVSNISTNFWSLASTLSGRADVAASAQAWDEEDASDDPYAGPSPGAAAPAQVADARLARVDEEQLEDVTTPARDSRPSRIMSRSAVDARLAAGDRPENFCDGSASGAAPLPLIGARHGAAGSDAPAAPIVEQAAGAIGLAWVSGVEPRARVALRLSLSRPGSVAWSVWDVGGRRLRGTRMVAFGAGVHDLVWDGRDGAGRACASGIYFAVAESGGRRSVARFVLAR